MITWPILDRFPCTLVAITITTSTCFLEPATSSGHLGLLQCCLQRAQQSWRHCLLMDIPFSTKWHAKIHSRLTVLMLYCQPSIWMTVGLASSHQPTSIPPNCVLLGSVLPHCCHFLLCSVNATVGVAISMATVISCITCDQGVVKLVWVEGINTIQ